jgi:hypothetical protein
MLEDSKNKQGIYHSSLIFKMILNQNVNLTHHDTGDIFQPDGKGT